MSRPTLTYITTNEQKIREARKVLGAQIERIALELPEIQSRSSAQVIKAKLQEAKKQVRDSSQRVLIVDDEGLEMEGLNADGRGALPGPYLKDMYYGLGGEKGLYQLAQCFGVKTAYATMQVGVSIPGREDKYFDVRIKGEIVPPQGECPNGYGAIFRIDGQTRTYAQMSIEERDAVWLRALALKQVQEYIESSLG